MWRLLLWTLYTLTIANKYYSKVEVTDSDKTLANDEALIITTVKSFITYPPKKTILVLYLWATLQPTLGGSPKIEADS